uniref:Uncharacterized protein n=1 Tax=Oryza glaberrima TaxID=4538 RepID=I1QUJ4_ORYGL
VADPPATAAGGSSGGGSLPPTRLPPAACSWFGSNPVKPLNQPRPNRSAGYTWVGLGYSKTRLNRIKYRKVDEAWDGAIAGVHAVAVREGNVVAVVAFGDGEVDAAKPGGDSAEIGRDERHEPQQEQYQPLASLLPWLGLVDRQWWLRRRRNHRAAPRTA